MEKIIKRAIEGGWKSGMMFLRMEKNIVEFATGTLKESPGVVTKEFVGFENIVLDPLFWQSLGKACGWVESGEYVVAKDTFMEKKIIIEKSSWLLHALRFHEINLTEGWTKAVEWLEELIK